MQNKNNEESDLSKIGDIVSGYWKPKDPKLWLYIKIIIVILVLLSTYQVWTLRQEIGYEQTKQLAECPNYQWNGTDWKANLTINRTNLFPVLIKLFLKV